MSGEIISRDAPEIDRIDGEVDLDVGQWYWVKSSNRIYLDTRLNYRYRQNEDGDGDESPIFDFDKTNDEFQPDQDQEIYLNDEGKKYRVVQYEWIACVTEIGSNFLLLEAPREDTIRIHFDDFYERLRREHNPERSIDGRVIHYRDEVQDGLAEVKRITARLGVSSSSKQIEKMSEAQSGTLVRLSGTENVDSYKLDLIKAKEKTLPALFEKIKEDSKSLTLWMKAQAIPLKAMVSGMTECIQEIEGRIFNVSLYAGLTEEVAQISDGEPAAINERLRIMQRRLYMDEECLANYRTGGMDFRTIDKFDEWLMEPENLNRIFPSPRCMVSFRVRRDKRTLVLGGSCGERRISVSEEEEDMKTYLYFRNGDLVYRMGCKLEFDEMIFPDRKEFDPSEPMMIQTGGFGDLDFISVREYEEETRDLNKRKKLSRKWRKNNPGESWMSNPHKDGLSWDFNPDSWEPFDDDSVYYDDAVAKITEHITYHNRIALIVQGLFDRSEVFHPHPPVRLWSGDGFAAAVELIYDGENILHAGEKPDFEVYRTECNSLIKKGSVVIGQDDFWQEKEAIKECRRMDNSWRDSRSSRPTRFVPYGDDGPGYLSVIHEWKPRARKATFVWTRERLRDSGWDRRAGALMEMRVIVPESRLFNVSAYKPGDYKQFFQDPRTREKYIKWAPLLLEAEEFHAGNVKPQEPQLVKDD